MPSQGQQELDQYIFTKPEMAKLLGISTNALWMRMKKLRKNDGVVFWITGLPGSGKSSISKNIFNTIEKRYGPTLRLNGNEIRKIFSLKGFTKLERLNIGFKYHELCKKISGSGINVLFDVVCLFEKIRKKNRKYLKNYLEIFIKSDIKTLVKKKQKYFYKIKTNNVWGVNLKPEFPSKPDIIIENNFKKSIQYLSDSLLKKIKKKLKWKKNIIGTNIIKKLNFQI